MFCKLQLQCRFGLAKIMLNQPLPEKSYCASLGFLLLQNTTKTMSKCDM